MKLIYIFLFIQVKFIKKKAVKKANFEGRLKVDQKLCRENGNSSDSFSPLTSFHFSTDTKMNKNEFLTIRIISLYSTKREKSTEKK